MEYSSFQNQLLKTLQPLYSLRESKNIVNIILFDLLHIQTVPTNHHLDINQSQLDKICKRISNKEPIQYITGISYFYEYPFYVNPSVLIPRPETEELVYHIINEEKGNKKSILDIGTGSGCIPITLKKKLPNFDIFATDVSKNALSVASQNAHKLQADIQFFHNDITIKKHWNQLPNIDIIVSNPPYITYDEKNKMPEHVLEWEPKIALFSGEDALVFYDIISDFAKNKLNPEGSIYFEINEFHGDATQQLLIEKGFKNVSLHQDLEGKDRILKGNL